MLCLAYWNETNVSFNASCGICLAHAVREIRKSIKSHARDFGNNGVEVFGGDKIPVEEQKLAWRNRICLHFSRCLFLRDNVNLK